MPKNIFFKILPIILILGLITNWLPKPVILEAQTINNPVLIPLEKFVFTPSRDKFTKPGLTDLEVKVVEYTPITKGSTCKFVFAQLTNLESTARQANQSSKNTTTTSKYENNSCSAILKKAEQISINIRITVEITTPTGEVYGSFLNFLTTGFEESLKIINPDEYELPLELYVKPEVNIILERKRLFVGDKIKVQVEVTNNDIFTLKEFSVKNTIPDKVGKIDCGSFQSVKDRLNGDIIKLPKVEVFAQDEVFTARCAVDQFNFEAGLKSLKTKQTTRLNFDISVEKPGKLKFEITTNLDQGRVSKSTEAIEIIVPTIESDSISGWAIFAIILGILASIGGGFGYYKYRQMKKREALNKSISSK